MDHDIAEITAYVFLDLAVIMVIARLMGRLAVKVGQPAVMGEIIAGILLGPTLLGALPGDLDTKLFPPDVRPFLNVLAQLGLVLFMFLVGLEVDLSFIRGRERIAVSVSVASIVLPFCLGVLLAAYLYTRHDVFTTGRRRDRAGRRSPGFALFLGVAMSITAFPVLARILSERGMHRIPTGRARAGLRGRGRRPGVGPARRRRRRRGGRLGQRRVPDPAVVGGLRAGDVPGRQAAAPAAGRPGTSASAS